MTRLERLHHKDSNGSGRRHIVIVPGNSGNSLDDQTCSHFPAWLDDIVATRDRCTTIWIFRHDILVESLDSWFAYCEAGEQLLQNLSDMHQGRSGDDALSDEDSLVLIGHKLGSFVLKKALVEANRQSHKSHMDALLNNIEILLMLGDPFLDSANQSEWISLILKCLPYKAIPQHMSCPQAAKCLAHVADRFEEFTLQSTLFQVVGTAGAERKRFLKLKRHAEDHGCICSANLNVRMWTTAAEEVAVEPGQGAKKECAFDPHSTLFQHLIAIPKFGNHYLTQGNSIMLQVSDRATIHDQSISSTTVCHQSKPMGLLAAPDVEELHEAQPNPSIESIALSDPLTEAQRVRKPLEAPVTDLNDGILTIGIDSQSFDSNSETPTPPLHSPTAGSDCQLLTREAASAMIVEFGHGSNASIEKFSADKSVPQTSRPRRRFRFFSTNVPPRDEMFIGRNDILSDVIDFLLPSPDLAVEPVGNPVSSSVVVLHGLAGVGKSSVALEATYRIQHNFDHVFWLRADSELHLAQSFHDAATSLKLVRSIADHDHTNSRQCFLAWLSTTTARWLLILNDADESQILAPFVPHLRRGSIISTSRRPLSEDLDARDTKGLRVLQIQLKPLDIVESKLFLQSFSINPTSVKSHDLEVIAEECRNLPLTLRRIATTLRHITLLGDKSAMARLERNISMRDLRSQAFVSAIPLAYSYLSNKAHRFMSVIALLDSYNIDDAILLGAQRCVDLPSMPLPMTDEDYFNTKEELLSNAIVSNAKPNSMCMHRVVQRAVRAKLSPVELAQAFHCACLLLEARWPSKRKIRNIILGNWPEFDSLHSHAHELTNVFVEHERSIVAVAGFSGQNDLLSDTYVRILVQSTWYNALRGNSKEDRSLIHLAHNLITRSSRLNALSKLEQAKELPKRLIDVGSDGPRLVDTAGQTGVYVAVSHCWGVSKTQLTRSNLSRLRQKIGRSDIQDSWRAAIEMTRELGVRYLWIDSLCTLQDDTEEKMNSIVTAEQVYSSAICTISEAIEEDPGAESNDQNSVLVQPFSVYLDWSRPEEAVWCHRRLQRPGWSWKNRVWTDIELSLSLRVAMSHPLSRISVLIEQVKDLNLVFSSAGCKTATEDTSQSRIALEDTHINEATLKINDGILCVENGKLFEALAHFMVAKDIGCTYKTPTVDSWKIHARASIHIALLFLMQNLPDSALNIMETVMKWHDDTWVLQGSPLLELRQVHFTMGGIYKVLDQPTNSLESYVQAGDSLELTADSDTDLADFKGVLGIKIAEHQLRLKEHKAAHVTLQESLEQFQKQDSVSAQAQLARILHCQSLVYEAEGSRFMRDAIAAAASHTWAAVRKAKGLPVPESTASLTTHDYVGEIQYWCR